jgi:7-carboxy-7-deazaguanine synthase
VLAVNEIFGPTIQGEGKKIGTISTFIRFGKCNMRCPGFGVEYETPSGIKKCSCDSFYAVDPSFKDKWDNYTSAEQIIEETKKFLPKNQKSDIVITGGEPLLYWRDEEFQKFLQYYIENDYAVTIETNGSLDIELTKAYQKKILFSISVKLSNSGESEKKRININTLTNIINFCDDAYLKFVIGADFLEQASDEIDDILAKIPAVETYIMPLGDDSYTIDKNSESVINLAIEKGFKYSDRLHIRVWNNKRGV